MPELDKKPLGREIIKSEAKFKPKEYIYIILILFGLATLMLLFIRFVAKPILTF